MSEKKKIKKQKKRAHNTAMRKAKKSRQKASRAKLQRFADSIGEVKSETWFLEELSKKQITVKFQQNKPLGKYIPDFLNKHYKIVIEIDGSIHDRKDIKEKDIKKDKAYKSMNYNVIRIIAYDYKSLSKGLSKLFRIMRLHKVNESKKRNITLKGKKYTYTRNTLKNSSKRCYLCKKQVKLKLVDYKGKSFKMCSICESKVIR